MVGFIKRMICYALIVGTPLCGIAGIGYAYMNTPTAKEIPPAEAFYRDNNCQNLPRLSMDLTNPDDLLPGSDEWLRFKCEVAGVATGRYDPPGPSKDAMDKWTEVLFGD